MVTKKMIFPVITGIEERLPYYPAGVGIDYEQENILRPNGDPRYQWVQCRSGQGELFIGENHYVVSEGQGMLFFPNEPHSYRSLDGNWKTDWVIFEGRCIGDFFDKTMGISGSGVYSVSAPSKIVGKIEELYYSSQRGPSAGGLCSALTYEILLDIMSHASKGENSSIDSRFKKLEPVINYINENYRKSFSLAELAAVAGVTPQHLCLSFKRFTSRTVFEYINMTKIRRSKELLMGNANMLVKEVAELSGFNDESYFCAMFRKFEKMSPMEFRNRKN